ncbi:hypothetical protein L1987_04294 [Smallanthus sonchifolius]|uniref:Uncharacterized protein n=1 Tax=Smallanthus sonchifolius TaxID=185202 RepID=A0ACB9KD11_9ASTR|nr:hypothetical protein L1987_04294 [Smallanthus sonchifolius]
MEIEKLSALRIGALGLPGDGIQAIAHGRKDQHFIESSIEIGNCYRIEAYACSEPNRHVNALPHPVNMRIGAASSIIPITNTDEFPRQYFNFCDRTTLDTLCDDENVSTDYFGILRGIEDKTKKDGSLYVVLTLMDASNQDIQVTLWEEVATSNERFDREAIENSPHPTILAVTAMKVTSFLGRLQLKSTFGTFTFINPKDAAIEGFLNSDRGIDDTTTATEQTTSSTSSAVNRELAYTMSTIIQKEKKDLAAQKDHHSGTVRGTVNRVSEVVVQATPPTTVIPTNPPVGSQQPKSKARIKQNPTAVKRLDFSTTDDGSATPKKSKKGD